MPTLFIHQEQQALLQQLRASGDTRQAAELQQLYHDREMAGLADDVYDAAKGVGQPEAGWTRGSENLDLLREQMPELRNLDDDELKEFLRPGDSGFRAEIYLPDPAILGPGYKPTVVPKGSAGEVLGPNGLRDTSGEDFLANNFPQSVGIQTDYYDRAMRLAWELKQAGVDFEMAGHSLAGGMASAASAVTGVPATTFNASGLHPATAPRFAQQNPGVRVYDANQTVRAHIVQGELLDDGVQKNLSRMDEVRRHDLSGVLSETSELLRELPQGRVLLQTGLTAMLPEGAPPTSRNAVNAFVEKLATGDTAQLLRELPLAAGQVQPLLPAMTRQGSQLMERERALSIQELTQLSGPVLEVLRATASGAHVGHQLGSGVAAVGNTQGHALGLAGEAQRTVAQAGGDAMHRVNQTVGSAAGAGVRHAGDAAAGVRRAAAEAEAGIDRLQGNAQRQGAEMGANALHNLGRLMPAGAQRWLDEQAEGLRQSGEQAQQRNQAEAAAALDKGQQQAAGIKAGADTLDQHIQQSHARAGAAQRAGMVGASDAVGAVLDNAGRTIQHASAQAPTAGAAVGAALGGGTASVNRFNPGNIANLPHLARTTELGTQALHGGREAIGRHSMSAAMVPSLDARIREAEQRAHETVQQRDGHVSTRIVDMPAVTVTAPRSQAQAQERGLDDPARERPAQESQEQQQWQQERQQQQLHQLQREEQRHDAAIQAATAQQGIAQAALGSGLLLSDPDHPAHEHYENARQGVVRVYSHQRMELDDRVEPMAASLVAQAQRDGLSHINDVRLSADGQHLVASNTLDATAAHRETIQVPAAQAAHQSVADSSQRWAQQHIIQAQEQLQTHTQALAQVQARMQVREYERVASHETPQPGRTESPAYRMAEPAREAYVPEQARMAAQDAPRPTDMAPSAAFASIRDPDPREQQERERARAAQAPTHEPDRGWAMADQARDARLASEPDERNQRRGMEEQRERFGPDHPSHPDHKLYTTIRGRTEELVARHGFDASEEQISRLAASTLVDVKRNKLADVAYLEFSENHQTGKIGENLIACQGNPYNVPIGRYCATNVELAINTPIEDATRKLDAVNQDLSQKQEQQLAQQQEQSRSSHRVVMG